MSLIKTVNLSPEIKKIILNSPENLNAMSEALAKEFSLVCDDLIKDETLRVVIITGEGKAFSSGGHLEMLQKKTALSHEENIKGMLEFYHSFAKVLKIPVPVIASFNGHAIGAGLGLGLFCDMRVAVETAKLGVNFVKIGLHPGMGTTFMLQKIVGYTKAQELLLTGRLISAKEALTCGLINQISDPTKLEEDTLTLALELAANGPQAMRELKQTTYLQIEKGLQLALENEAACQAKDYAGSELSKALKALINKEPISFI